MKFATQPIQRCPSHLRHVATLPWEIKNSNILCIYSADMEENADKFLYACNLYAECNYAFLSKSCPRRRIPR